MTGEELRLAETEQRARSNSRRIDRLEARQDETDKLVAAMASLRSEQSYIKQDVAEIKEDVKQLALKPARRWETLAEQALLCLLSAGVAALLANITG
ncbi:MAG: hypothetical protein IIY16_01220 [Oscillospiraceae bacterium]|nr:hypothetical protein [Oscillospiraceae bacterium]